MAKKTSGGERTGKAEVAYFMRRLYSRGLTTTSGGNISLRIADDRVLITPSGSDKGRMRADEIGVVDLEGRPLSGGFKPSIETSAHLRIYLARKDIAAIVHAHPSHASALAATTCSVNTRLLAESRAVLGDVSRVGYHLMGSSDLADALACALTGANCALMQNHGAIAVGTSLLEAFDRLEVLEEASYLTITSLSTLKPWSTEISRSGLKDIDEMMEARRPPRPGCA